jgi:hypothetical protein
MNVSVTSTDTVSPTKICQSPSNVPIFSPAEVVIKYRVHARPVDDTPLFTALTLATVNVMGLVWAVSVGLMGALLRRRNGCA